MWQHGWQKGHTGPIVGHHATTFFLLQCLRTENFSGDRPTQQAHLIYHQRLFSVGPPFNAYECPRGLVHVDEKLAFRKASEKWNLATRIKKLRFGLKTLAFIWNSWNPTKVEVQDDLLTRVEWRRTTAPYSRKFINKIYETKNDIACVVLVK